MKLFGIEIKINYIRRYRGAGKRIVIVIEYGGNNESLLPKIPTGNDTVKV